MNSCAYMYTLREWTDIEAFQIIFMGLFSNSCLLTQGIFVSLELYEAKWSVSADHFIVCRHPATGHLHWHTYSLDTPGTIWSHGLTLNVDICCHMYMQLTFVSHSNSHRMQVANTTSPQDPDIVPMSSGPPRGTSYTAKIRKLPQMTAKWSASYKRKQDFRLFG